MVSLVILAKVVRILGCLISGCGILFLVNRKEIMRHDVDENFKIVTIGCLVLGTLSIVIMSIVIEVLG